MPPDRPRYLNPFEGRRKPIPLSGLFLFDPEVPMRLEGMSLRTAFTLMGEESLYKCLERAEKTGKVSASLRNRVLGLLPAALGNDLAGLLDAPHASTHRCAHMGPWEVFLRSTMHVEHGAPLAWPRSAQYIRDIEQSSREATILFGAGQGRSAAECLDRQPLLRAFLTPESLHGMAQANSIDDLLALRITTALEVWLSLIALWDIESRPDDSDDSRSCVTRLLDQSPTGTRNSAAQLFQWLMTTAGVTSTAAFMTDSRLRDLNVHIGTVDTWRRGTHFPSISYATAYARALLSPDEVADFKTLFAAARQLNFLGYVAQLHEKILERLARSGDARPRPPGTGLPFGHDSVEAWLRCRYPIWLQFHRTPSEA